MSEAQLAALRAYYGMDQPLAPPVPVVAGQRRSPATWATTSTPGSRSLDMTLSALPITFELAVLATHRGPRHRHPARARSRRPGRTASATRSSQTVGLLALAIPSFLLGSVLIAYVSKWFRYNPNSLALRAAHRGPVAQPPAAAVPGAGAGLRARGAHHAHRPHVTARGADPGLRAHRAWQGRVARTHPDAPRAAGGAHPHRDHDRHPVRLPAGWRDRGGAAVLRCPGLGRQVLLGIQQKEFAVVQSTVLVVALLFVLVNIATD